MCAVSSAQRKPLPDDMLLINIVPLQAEFVEEIAGDMKSAENRNACTAHLLQMYMVPDGGAVPVDKTSDFIPVYKSILRQAGELKYPVGILIQSIMGHEKLLYFSDMQRIVSFDGKLRNDYCPADAKFKEYVANNIGILAALNPDFMMIDDDTRLWTSRYGCACPIHLERLEKALGRKITREELGRRLNGTSAEDVRIAKIFDENNKDSVLELMKVIRNAVDKTDKRMPIIYCQCAEDGRYSTEIAEILAGDGNPSVCRINNARYWKIGASNRTFPEKIYSTAVQMKVLERVDRKLAEIDSYYRNRYSTSATVLHSLYAASIVEGCVGAKFWPSNLCGRDNESFDVYTKAIGKNSAFYKKLISEVKKVKFDGITAPIPSDGFYQFNPITSISQSAPVFANTVIARMGFPLNYATSAQADTYVIDENIVKRLSNCELMEILSKNVLMDSPAAMNIQERGMGRLLGAKVEKTQRFESVAEIPAYKRGYSNYEKIFADWDYEIKDLAPQTEILSKFKHIKYYYANTQNSDDFGAAATLYKNPSGAKVAIIAGRANSHARFMCSARKKMFEYIFSEIKPLDAYYGGDAEIYLKCGRYQDGSLFVFMVNIGLDTEETVKIVSKGEWKSIHALSSEGEFIPAAFDKSGSVYTIKTHMHSMTPLVLKFSK